MCEQELGGRSRLWKRRGAVVTEVQARCGTVGKLWPAGLQREMAGWWLLLDDAGKMLHPGSGVGAEQCDGVLQ